MSNGRRQSGFTIIETMLFLGVTGLIMSFMLVGVSTQLNQRRYQDASTSLVTYVQNQYSLVSNVNNSRDPNESCSSGRIDATGGSSGPGTSDDCTIVGRLLRSSDSGKTINATQVVATVDAASLPFSPGDSDVKILHDARLTTSLTTEPYSTQWGTSLVQPAPNNAQPSSFSVLIVRMPTSGVVHTFANSDENITLDNLIATANVTTFDLCLASNGIGAGAPNGVRIDKDATNTGSIEFISQGDC